MQQPNILVLMVDQMQARVLDQGHPCRTPNLDGLAERGVRFTRAYTPNPVCSPARASLMTGLLPHNHGVLWVTNSVDPDQGRLRTDKLHWAQRLAAHGYRTGYFGKWHVEHDECPGAFGWQTDGSDHSALMRDWTAEAVDGPSYTHARNHPDIPGYESPLHYAVTEAEPESRHMGMVTSLANDWLDNQLRSDSPWCCFVSVTEPHDPFVAGEQAYKQYDVDALELPPNGDDDLHDRPALYRKAARQWRELGVRERKEAMACYYASITEIDGLFGKILERVERAGQRDNTIVVVVSDHGELLGAHGMFCKNIMASEEIYNIPLTIAGPGVARGRTSSARVGLHDVGSTLLELTGSGTLDDIDGQSFAAVLEDPGSHDDDHVDGYAEYHGGRYLLTQRVLWDHSWKYVFNGFDEDELYDLESDPYELVNLAGCPEHRIRLATMIQKFWDVVRDSGDTSLLNTHYPQLRLATRGPHARDQEPVA